MLFLKNTENKTNLYLAFQRHKGKKDKGKK
jgi:hypothetical protein